MKKIRLNESQLSQIISQIITEQSYSGGIIQKGDIPCDIWCERKYAKRGSRGDVVKMIQHLLARGCGDYGPYNVENIGGGMNEGCAENWTNCDGKFGKETKKAVEKLPKFKVKHDLDLLEEQAQNVLYSGRDIKEVWNHLGQTFKSSGIPVAAPKGFLQIESK